MFENTNTTVGNCRVLTDAERSKLAHDIFNKKVDGYWIKVKGEVIANKSLGGLLVEIRTRDAENNDKNIDNINKDIEIEHKFGAWGTVGTLRGYTPRQLKIKFGDI